MPSIKLVIIFILESPIPADMYRYFPVIFPNITITGTCKIAIMIPMTPATPKLKYKRTPEPNKKIGILKKKGNITVPSKNSKSDETRLESFPAEFP